MNKKYWLLTALFFCFSFISVPAYSKTAIIGPLTALTGGLTGALDSVECDDILGDNTDRAIATGDVAIVVTSGGLLYFYRYDSTGADAESSPDIIVPDDRADCAGAGQWELVSPITVAQGGTGAGTFTDHGVLVGSGTGAVTALSVGTATQALMGVADADPAFTTLREFSRLELTADTSISAAQVIGNRYITNQGDADEADLTLPAVSYGIGVIFIIEEALNIEINPPAGEAFDLDGVTLDANDCVDSDSTVGSKISATRMKNAAGTWHWSLDTIRGVWIDRGASD